MAESRPIPDDAPDITIHPSTERRGWLQLVLVAGALAKVPSFPDVERPYQSSCSLLLEFYRSYTPSGKPPPKVLDEHIKDAMTMNGINSQSMTAIAGQIQYAEFFVDDSMKGQGSHYVHREKEIIRMIDSFGPGKLDLKRFRPTELWLWNAIKAYPVSGQHALVFGSTSPYHESLLLSAGARHVTTVEYNKLTYENKAMTTSTPGQLVVPEGGFDVALSISSFDHDGLGRYGDPIDPFGDLKAMDIARCILKDNGLLYLTVPVGKDIVAYNLHRRYGRVRLPHLLHGWKIEGVEGWNDAALDADGNYRQSYEPVFVLRKVPHVPSKSDL